jgi:hypothetical protein
VAFDRGRWGWTAAGIALLGVAVVLIAALVGTDHDPVPSSSATTTSTSPEGWRLTRLTADDFSIDYPVGWSVQRVDHVPAGATYLDTTVRRTRGSSDHLLRVDVLPAGDPRSVADDALAALRERHDFTLRHDRATRIVTRSGTYDAVELEFDLGVIRSVDVIFEDGVGRVFAVLTRAPAAEHDDWVALYDRVRSSIRAS